MPKHAERRIASPATWNGVANTSGAQALGQQHGIRGAAARQYGEELVLARAAQEIVATQQTTGTLDDLAQQVVAGLPYPGGCSNGQSPPSMSSSSRQSCVFMRLHAVCLAKQHGEQRGAVVDAGQRVLLGD